MMEMQTTFAIHRTGKRLEDFLFAPGAESFDLPHVAGLAGGLKFRNTADAKRLVKLIDFLYVEAGHICKLQNSRWQFGTQLFQERRFARRIEFLNLLRDGKANSFHERQAILFYEFADVFSQLCYGARPGFVGAGFEVLAALQLKQRSNLL